MKNHNKSVEIPLNNDGIRRIEYFVEEVCDQLLINQTYSGNILMALSELFNLARQFNSEEKLTFAYTTDYQAIKINIQHLDIQIIKLLNNKIDLNEYEYKNLYNSLYLVEILTDKIELIGNSEMNFVFDISAVHSKVYNHRLKTLNVYFNHISQKINKANDIL